MNSYEFKSGSLLKYMNINLREYVCRNPNELADLLDGDVERVIEIIERFNRGEFYKKSYLVETKTPARMTEYISLLAQSGLDIGKGDSDFGYRMPLPEKKDTHRDLIIFRRN